MNHPYYQQKLFVAQVNKNNQILGKVERWQAHLKGTLHRGFTVILTYQNQLLIQKRKHPAFNKHWDLTFSSHQVYKNNHLESTSEAIFKSLKREWFLNKNDLKEPPKKLGKLYYYASDPYSSYIEHEIDYIYFAELKKLPQPNYHFSYKYLLVPTIDQINQLPSQFIIAPWVKKIISNLNISSLTSAIK